MAIEQKPIKKELIFELSIYALFLLLVATLWNKPIILMTCFALMSLIILLIWNTKKDLLFYFVAFFLGSIAESISVYFGAWKYSKTFYLIPLWLPFAWGIAGLLVKHISETLSEIGSKQ